MNVGAIIDLPPSQMFRIRRNLMQIRSLYRTGDR